jgi:hypothetical protein
LGKQEGKDGKGQTIKQIWQMKEREKNKVVRYQRIKAVWNELKALRYGTDFCEQVIGDLFTVGRQSIYEALKFDVPDAGPPVPAPLLKSDAAWLKEYLKQSLKRN